MWEKNLQDEEDYSSESGSTTCCSDDDEVAFSVMAWLDKLPEDKSNSCQPLTLVMWYDSNQIHKQVVSRLTLDFLL